MAEASRKTFCTITGYRNSLFFKDSDAFGILDILRFLSNQQFTLTVTAKLMQGKVWSVEPNSKLLFRTVLQDQFHRIRCLQS